MKIFLISLLNIFVFSGAYAQFKAEQVFIVGEHCLDQECRVETYPDWGELVFVTDSLFLSSSFIAPDGRHDSLHVFGKYNVRGDTLMLTNIKTASDLWFHGDSMYETYRIENKARLEKMFPDMRFKIDSCKNGKLVLRSLAGPKTWFGSLDARGDGTIRKFKEWGIWDRVLHPPQH